MVLAEDDISLDNMSWFKQLPKDWQSWVLENLQRGCDPQGIADVLHQNGFRVSAGEQQAAVQQLDNTEQQLFKAHTEHGWKKWLAQALLAHTPEADIVQQLQDAGLDATWIQQALAEAQQSPYLSLAAEYRQQLKKREWLLHTIDQLARLNPAYASDIERIATPDFASFIRHYYSQHRPVILLGGIDHWPALQRWCPQYFLDRVGKVDVEVQQGREQDRLFERRSHQYRSKMMMQDFIAGLQASDSSNNMYMTANNAARNMQGLSPLFEDIADFGPGYTRPAQASSRSFIWFGPKGTFTPLHHDLTNNMLVQVYGRKKVTLIPALQTPYLYNDSGVYSEVDNPHDSTLAAQYPLLQQTSRLELVLQPGEALFIPIGWWHCVESLDVSISVSFTHFDAPNHFAADFPHD